MRLKILHIILIPLIWACGEGAEKANEVDVKLREGEAGFVEVDESLDTAVIIDPKMSRDLAGLTDFIELYRVAYDSVRSSKMILVERFGAVEKQKFGLKRKQAIILKNDTILFQPAIDIWTMNYRDSSQMSNVLRNWFMEFGSDRQEVSIGENSIVASFPIRAIINERQIAIISVPCAQDTCFDRRIILENFSQLYMEDESTVLDVDCNNNLRWLQFSLPKKEEIKDSTSNQDTSDYI